MLANPAMCILILDTSHGPSNPLCLRYTAAQCLQPMGLSVQSQVASNAPSRSRNSTIFVPESLTLA